jgi:hypothetical protein
MVSLQLLSAVALGQPFHVPGYTDSTYRGTYPSPALPDVEKLLSSIQITRKSVAWFYVTIDGELLSPSKYLTIQSDVVMIPGDRETVLRRSVKFNYRLS